MPTYTLDPMKRQPPPHQEEGTGTFLVNGHLLIISNLDAHWCAESINHQIRSVILEPIQPVAIYKASGCSCIKQDSASLPSENSMEQEFEAFGVLGHTQSMHS